MLRVHAADEVLVTMLADDDAASNIAFGQRSHRQSAQGAIHLSMSTISVALSSASRRRTQRPGSATWPAPVFGRPDAAASAKLFIVVAGDAATIDVLSAAVSCDGTVGHFRSARSRRRRIL